MNTTVCFVAGDSDAQPQSARSAAAALFSTLRVLAIAKTFAIIDNHRIDLADKDGNTFSVIVEPASNKDAGRGIDHVFSVKRML